MHPYGRTFQILNWNSGYPPFVCGIGWLSPRQLGDSLGYSVCGIPLAGEHGCRGGPRSLLHHQPRHSQRQFDNRIVS